MGSSERTCLKVDSSGVNGWFLRISNISFGTSDKEYEIEWIIGIPMSLW